jgi:hypothetical protein
MSTSRNSALSVMIGRVRYTVARDTESSIARARFKSCSAVKCSFCAKAASKMASR